MELIVWYEPGRITHAEAAAKAEFLPRQSVADFAREVAGDVIGGDKKSHVRLSVTDRAVPRIRYIAGKHRLVCYEPQRQAVLNPPLLRRSGAYELSFCIGHSIDDPSPGHITAAIEALTAQNWFVVLDDGEDHYLQVALTADGYLLEVRDGNADKHFQVPVKAVEDVIAAFHQQATGDAVWRDRFEWRQVDG